MNNVIKGFCQKCGGKITSQHCRFCKLEYGRWLEKKNIKKRRLQYKSIHFKETCRIWRKNNKEKCRKIGIRWYRLHKEQAKKIAYKWQKNNPEKVKINKKRCYEKSKNDSQFLLNNSMRAGIYDSLKGYKNGRKWQELVGYTVDELKKRLESLFVNGMTWQNYGKEWHIDHIWPLSRLYIDGVDDPTFRFAWSLKNLQPMWGADNIRKGNKISNVA